MHLHVKSIMFAVVALLGGADMAFARERTPAPIEFARPFTRTPQPQADEKHAEPAAVVTPARSSVGGRGPNALEMPEILYGYGARPASASRSPLDLRGSLKLTRETGSLGDDAFDDVAPTLPAPAAAEVAQVDAEAAAPEHETRVDALETTHEVTGRQAEPSEGSPPGGYFIQIGAFANPANAERVKAALADVGAVTIDEKQGASATLHRVRVGQWPSRTAAELARDVIVGRGFEGAMVSQAP